MKKQRYAIAVIVSLIMAVASGWSLLDAAPQTANGSKSRTQMDQQTYNETYGAEQIIILGQIDTTPQTTNGSKSITQIAQQKYNPTYGANQVILSTSTGLQVPFTNISSLANSDLLVYDSTDAAWENRAQSTLLHNNFGGLTTGDPHTQYPYLLGRAGGQSLMVGVGTGTPARSLESINTSGFQYRATYTAGSVYTDFGTDSSGNFIVTPTGKLSVTTGALFQTAVNSTTAFQVKNSAGTSTVLNVDTTNNRVGIGNAAPAEALQVNGNILTAGNVFVGLNNIIKTSLIRSNGFNSRVDFQDTLGTAVFTILDSGKVGVNTVAPVSDFEIDGSTGYNVSIVGTATYDILTTDNTIGVSYTDTGTVALTLPAASSVWNSTDSIGIRYLIKDLDCNASANNITISRNATPGTDTITTTTEGNASVVMSTDGAAIWIQAVSASEWAVF